MNPIFIFGHKNPDTDSICSTLALTELKTKLGENVKAHRLGEVNNETSFVLDYFKIDAPEILKEVSAKQEVILVDHNEKAQSVDGLENAKILQVVDHHKFGNFSTDEPVKIDADTVGCTSTIIFKLFKEAQITPSKEIAGLMMSAILSDTLLFKSPTCTERDKQAVKELAEIAGEKDFEAYGMKMLIAGTSLKGMTSQEIISIDMKAFDMNGSKVSISQINTVDIPGILEMQKDFEDSMTANNKANDYVLSLLVVTDIIKAGSYILAVGERQDLVEKAYNVKLENNIVWLDGVVSRKKQVVPVLMEASQN